MAHLMHFLRTSSLLVRLVLAGFVLTLGAATAAPLVQPTTMAVLCAEGEVKVVMLDADGAPTHARAHTLDCPLCLPASLVPAQAAAPALPPLPRASAPQAFLSAAITVSAGAPLPARGPPSAFEFALR